MFTRHHNILDAAITAIVKAAFLARRQHRRCFTLGATVVVAASHWIGASHAGAATIIRPDSATSTIAGDAGSSVNFLLSDNGGSGLQSLQRPLGNLVGLPTGTDLADALATFAERSGSGQAESWTRPTNQGNPVFSFDLGQNTAIQSIILWQYGNNGGGATSFGNDTRDFELIFHTDAEGDTFSFASGGGTEATEFDGTMANAGAGTSTNVAQLFDFGSKQTARYIGLRIATNYLGQPGVGGGGDRYGLGEVRFVAAVVPEPSALVLVAFAFAGLGMLRRRPRSGRQVTKAALLVLTACGVLAGGVTDARAANISLGASYAYELNLPTFVGGTFYIDDPHVQVLGAFDTGDLTDGVIHNTTPTVPPVNTLVGWDNPVSKPANVIIDLGGFFNVSDVIVGTETWQPFANGAPDSVAVSLSLDNVSYSTPTNAVFTAADVPSDGHHDLTVDLPDGKARYVRFDFDGGAVLTGNTPNKWMLDELTVNGTQLPEPTAITLCFMSFCGVLAGWRRRSRTSILTSR